MTNHSREWLDRRFHRMIATTPGHSLFESLTRLKLWVTYRRRETVTPSNYLHCFVSA
jgi:hypothetical protein